MSDSSPAGNVRWTRKHWLRGGILLGVLGISAAILGTILYQQWDVLVSYPWEFRPLPLLFAFGCYTLALFLVVWVWADMMHKLGYPIHFWKHFRYYCMTNLSKRLPGTVWYIAGRAQFYKEDGIPRRVTSAMSGVEMGVMVVAGIVISLIFGLPFLLRYQINLWVIGGVFLGCILVLHPGVLRVAMRRLGADVSGFGYRDLMTWVGVYLLVWISGGGILFFICQIVVAVPLSNFGYMVGSWTLVGLLGVIFFFSPSNLGVSEVGFSLLLATIMPPPVAVIVALMVRILPFFYELLWALASMGLERGELSRN